MTKLKHYPSEPNSEKSMGAFYILRSSHDSASSFLNLFEKERKGRGARGAPTDEEHDLLRAMLLFALSGLDSMIKQLVLDALPAIIDLDPGANELFKTFLERRLRRSADGVDCRFLASAVADPSPRLALVKELVIDLRSASLQSKDQLLKVAAHFNIASRDLTDDPEKLQRIFDARNQIAHEMDIDFTQPNRSRRPRRTRDMKDHVNEIFRISSVFLQIVDGKLQAASSEAR
jgi:hypothetical protein